MSTVVSSIAELIYIHLPKRHLGTLNIHLFNVNEYRLFARHQESIKGFLLHFLNQVSIWSKLQREN